MDGSGFKGSSGNWVDRALNTSPRASRASRRRRARASRPLGRARRGARVAASRPPRSGSRLGESEGGAYFCAGAMSAEDSIRDLLERLASVAAGGATSHDKPANIVGEVKDVLDYLAEDELPAVSAVFLAKVRARDAFSKRRDPRRERAVPLPFPRPPPTRSIR